MEVRTLRAGEEEALLALLDPWSIGDGWSGRDFFRRYLELDPTYAPENVWVAEDDGRLVCCVQIFPRRIRLRGHAVPCGGIGSVYTRESRRREGIGSRVLARSVEAMAARGMELALLFAGPVAWYEGQGWRSWPRRRVLLDGSGVARGPGTGAAGERFDAFAANRDLDAAMALHERFDADRDGSVVRDAALWRASLVLAGNPDEEFRVARRGGSLLAYARAIVLEGLPLLSEHACEPGEEEALADLVAGLVPRGPEATHMMAGTVGRDHALHGALEARGIGISEVRDPTAVLRCLDAPALGRRLGTAPVADESPEDFLARILPPEAFCVWPSDRF